MPLVALQAAPYVIEFKVLPAVMAGGALLLVQLEKLEVHGLQEVFRLAARQFAEPGVDFDQDFTNRVLGGARARVWLGLG